jgi:hypothetical protein
MAIPSGIRGHQACQGYETAAAARGGQSRLLRSPTEPTVDRARPAITTFPGMGALGDAREQA